MFIATYLVGALLRRLVDGFLVLHWKIRGLKPVGRSYLVSFLPSWRYCESLSMMWEKISRKTASAMIPFISTSHMLYLSITLDALNCFRSSVMSG